MAFDTFAQLLPKQIVNVFRWLIFSVILFSFKIYTTGGTFHPLSNSTDLSRAVRYFFGSITVDIPAGWQGFFLCMLMVIWLRIYYRIGSYFGNIWVAVYIMIVEHKRLQKINLKQKILYCFTWPIYDIIERYVKYLALFVKVEWKTIPHNSTVTIDDLAE